MLSSLARHSGSNVFKSGHLLIVLKNYFDGSGKADDPNSRFVTLAGFAAEDPVWAYFDKEWAAILGDRGNPAYVHMKEAIPFVGEYQGWDRERVIFILQGLIGLIRQMPKNHRFHAFRCTVDLVAHRRLKQLYRLPSPERICARWAFGKMYVWYSQHPMPILETLDIFFDRNENFLKHLYHDWNNKTVRKEFPWWDLVSTIAPLDMRKSPGLQAADMLAWCSNRLRGDHRVDWIDELCRDVIVSPACWNIDIDGEALQNLKAVLTDDYFTKIPKNW